MGNELAARDQGVTGCQTNTSCEPGRTSAAASYGEGVSSYEDVAFEDISSEETDLARVALRAGERVTDPARFEYVAHTDGSFEVVKAPVPFSSSVGKRITQAEIPPVWGWLHGLLMARPAPAAPQAVAPRRAPSPTKERTQAEMLQNEQALRSNDPTMKGTALDAGKAKADAGNANTHYSLDDASFTSGRADVNTFYCSAFAMWTLASTGLNLQAPIVGADGVPFTYTKLEKAKSAEEAKARRNTRLMKQIAAAGQSIAEDEFPISQQITFRKLCDGDYLAVMMMTKIQTENLENGCWLGAHPYPTAEVFEELVDGENTATAARGIAGAIELFGIGREVPESEQKPGDFVQSRKPNEKTGQQDGTGHAYEVWSVRARGTAALGQDGSPTSDESGTGWKHGVEFVIDKDTKPALVGKHEVVAARRLEANREGAMETKAKGSDGGVQLTSEKPVPAPRAKDEQVFVGRLASSPWSGWENIDPAE